MLPLMNSPNTVPASSLSHLKYRITMREKQMLELLARGFSYRMIGLEVSISRDTVKAHLKNVYQKLQAQSGTHAVAKAIWEGII
jgi:DNA-binding NarL/FixJ family response regulator